MKPSSTILLEADVQRLKAVKHYVKHNRSANLRIAALAQLLYAK